MSEKSGLEKKVQAVDAQLAPWAALAGKLKLLVGFTVALVAIVLVVATGGGKTLLCKAYLDASGREAQVWTPLRDRYGHAFLALEGVAESRSLSVPDAAEVEERRLAGGAVELRWMDGETRRRFLVEQRDDGVWIVNELEGEPSGWCTG